MNPDRITSNKEILFFCQNLKVIENEFHKFDIYIYVDEFTVRNFYMYLSIRECVIVTRLTDSLSCQYLQYFGANRKTWIFSGLRRNAYFNYLSKIHFTLYRKEWPPHMFIRPYCI